MALSGSDYLPASRASRGQWWCPAPPLTSAWSVQRPPPRRLVMAFASPPPVLSPCRPARPPRRPLRLRRNGPPSVADGRLRRLSSLASTAGSPLRQAGGWRPPLPPYAAPRMDAAVPGAAAAAAAANDDVASNDASVTDSVLRVRVRRVGHLTDYCDGAMVKQHPNPIRRAMADGFGFVPEGEVVLKNVALRADASGTAALDGDAGLEFQAVCRTGQDAPAYIRAGPRETVYFEPRAVRAAIVTCGGIAPGLNTVIRAIVLTLTREYGVETVFGIQSGYRGFYAKNWLALTPELVENIHKDGGTFLGSSRGGHDTTRIVDALETRGINQLYVCGGDGTVAGAMALQEEIIKRRLPIALCTLPKTVDDDLCVIDKSFGFETAVGEAQHAINAAAREARDFPNGIGLVKLMGRNSGFIAVHAALASGEADCVLIPEVPFAISGPGGLLEYIERQLAERGKVVIVVAEGAGQEHVADAVGARRSRDASGNKLLSDIGLRLLNDIKAHFAVAGTEVSCKFIDPTYMVRSCPPCAGDSLLCTLLAHSAVHGLFGGHSGFMVGPVNGVNVYVPFQEVAGKKKVVDVARGRLWLRLLSSTGQPDFALPNGQPAQRGSSAVSSVSTDSL
ncbi:hypothetical protein I4F81_003956 [Pyropia yezoensis]|uniref:Uncharacterized protein n=1 Tax=Pyropia yezoensis TaxID=2788 RepID=A0ACC3BV16_PYRYE|nr:hypothetical protein I4F81_003956 [Neopyropia yezoensis]